MNEITSVVNECFSLRPPLQYLQQNTLMALRTRHRFLKINAGAAGQSTIRFSAFTKLPHEDLPCHSFRRRRPGRSSSMFHPGVRTGSIGIDSLRTAFTDRSIKGDSNSD